MGSAWVHGACAREHWCSTGTAAVRTEGHWPSCPGCHHQRWRCWQVSDWVRFTTGLISLGDGYMHTCLAVTCTFGKMIAIFLLSTYGDTGVERTQNKRQHRHFTLGKKILPLLLQGIKLASFWSLSPALLTELLCGNLSGKWAQMQLVREHPFTVISGCRATVDLSWPKEWNCCAYADHNWKGKKKQKHPRKRIEKKITWGEWLLTQSPPPPCWKS